MRASSRNGEMMGRERGRSRGLELRSADVGQARVLAPFALTRIQVVWISVWVSLSVCRTFEILRSRRDMCEFIQKAETIEPAIIRTVYRENHYAPLLRGRKSVTRDSYSYNRRMSRGPPAVFQSALEGWP